MSTFFRTITTSVRAEFARLVSSRMAVLALVALMTIPVVYGGLYLWGNKDPYGSLDKVPAAIVVADEGAKVDGEQQNYGREAAKTLLDGKKFAWHEVSAVAASRGVKNGTYDFAVEFPADFSSRIASASGDAPAPARLGLITSDTNSYLSSTIATQATTTVRAAIVEKVGRAATLQLLDGVQSLRDGLSDAADGAQQLSDGAHTASDGATKLASGASEVDAGAGRLTAGAQTASDGASKLADGAASASSGAAKLADGAAATASGAQAVSTGIGTIADKLALVSTGLAELTAKTAELPTAAAALAQGTGFVAGQVTTLHGTATDAQTRLAAALASSTISDADKAELTRLVAALADDTATGSPLQTATAGAAAGAADLSAAAPALKKAVSDASAGAAALASGAQTAKSGSAQVADGASQVSTGASALKDGTAQLATGATALKSGTAQLASGASTLKTGTGQLASGASDLADGTTKLADGADTLHGKLVDGVAQTPSKTDAQRAAAAKAVADPVNVKRTSQTEAENYGAGLAPFFISLAAWIGIYALFLLVRPLSRRALTAVRRPVSTALAGWATPALLGVVQMVGLFLVLAGPLGLKMAHPVELLGFMALVTVTYAAIVMALNVWLGSVGQFLGLVLMVVQLVTAGGTFPWQTLPAPLAALHQALPMSHAVDGIRALLYGGGAAGLSSALLTLVIWLVVALALSIAGAAKQSRFRTLRELRPSPIGG
ncbi:YhgE/Pip domain-containing protein [Schumannella luteola]|uniref:Putative membrane protein n=1 Tax=Schumannella luteola TaxID=472059 RepID=A0A852Y7E5_9MICO|nr:YhgE/Pip domain-containing protein [Schumannella luteola]NYG98253.1 putative membrane protein [Schumannella luteola]TPX02132.1 YhgE/Pip domain-containing protein [Schumannella luteola]